MIHVQLAHLIVTLLRVERRRSKIDDTIPEEGLVLELLFYGVPVIEQEVEQSFIAGRTAGQHTKDQVDVRVREILVLVQDGYLQQSNAEDAKTM